MATDDREHQKAGEPPQTLRTASSDGVAASRRSERGAVTRVDYVTNADGDPVGVRLRPTGCPVPRVSDCCGEPIVNDLFCSLCNGQCVECPDISGLLEEIGKEPVNMPDVIRIELDGPVPTEEGWCFVLAENSIPTAVRVIRFGNVLGVADESRGTWRSFGGDEHLARWSRRIEIGG